MEEPRITGDSGLRHTPEVVSFPGFVHNRGLSEVMRTKRPSHGGIVASALIVAFAIVATANAATCSDRTVQARGEPSSFEVLAKAKARGNWRAQVRAMPALGPLYANWNIAQSADYACSEGKGGYICTAAARPCRE